MTTDFVIPNRPFINEFTPRGGKPILTLPEVLTKLKVLRDLQLPQPQVGKKVWDVSMRLDQLAVDWTKSRLVATKFLEANPEPWYFTSNGGSQMATAILPGHEYGNLRKLAGLGENGAKLASLVWREWARQQASEPSMLVRTFRTRLAANEPPVTAIRACLSMNYATYSNVKFIEDIMTYGGAMASLPVLDLSVFDNSMRVRFLAKAPDPFNQNTPVVMVEAWNSEVGRRKVVLRGGLWKPSSATSMGHWDTNKDREWRHYGNPERIQAGVQAAFESVIIAAEGVLDAYNRATDIEVDEAFRWMESQLKERVSERAIENAKEAYADPTVTPGGKLASIVDAVSLAAKKELDIEEQYAIELEAARLLRTGLSQAQDGHLNKKAA